MTLRFSLPFVICLVLVLGAGAACAVPIYTFTDLGTLGGSSSYACSLNDAGQVAGYSYTAGAVMHGFEYSGGSMSDLGTLGGSTSYARGINDTGQIVGYSTITTGATRAFLYSGGSMSDLGTLGGNGSWAYGISDTGKIAGYSTTSTGNSRAFLYSGGSMVDLGTLGGTDSYASGINELGQIVGTSTLAGGGPNHAFLREGSTMYDLNDLLTASNGWTLNEALAINEWGDICGYATDPQEQVHAFFAYRTDRNVVPEPGTLVLLGMGLGALVFYRRRRQA